MSLGEAAIVGPVPLGTVVRAAAHATPPDADDSQEDWLPPSRMPQHLIEARELEQWRNAGGALTA